MNLAIVIGVEKYKSSNFGNLPACANDAKAMKDVLENIKDLKEILYINQNESAYEIKNKISDFTEKYKNTETEINEVLFYFSGHGERIEDDFFYVFYDFERARKESTSLRNTELDNLIKGLSPKLFVKIVDACFSGTQYIKSESVVLETEIKKSANASGFRDIYFLFSSRENEVSHAGKEFSKFTESILTALIERTGNIRYADVISFVADDLSSNTSVPKPMFITQSEGTEKFGNITEETHKIIYDYFGLSTEQESESQSNFSNINENKELTIADRIIQQSQKICFDENKLVDFVKGFSLNIKDSWSANIPDIYEINFSEQSATHIPNAVKIGFWLSEHKKENFFAIPSYKEEVFKTQEYKKVPKKPNKKYGTALMSLGSSLFPEHEDNFEYKLEDVKEVKKVVNGFSYTYSLNDFSFDDSKLEIKPIIHIAFKPKLGLVSSLSLYIVPIFSNKRFVIHYCYEVLPRKNWNSDYSPECEDWKVLDVNINKAESDKLASEHIKNDFYQWFENYCKELLDKYS